MITGKTIVSAALKGAVLGGGLIATALMCQQDELKTHARIQSDMLCGGFAVVSARSPDKKLQLEGRAVATQAACVTRARELYMQDIDRKLKLTPS